MGMGLHIVALGWYLLARTGSATSVALVWTVGLGSGIVMLPLAGPLADRYPRRILAIAADLARLGLVGTMAALAYVGRPSLAYLRRHRAVAGFGVASVIPWVATISLNVVIVPYVLQALRLSATAYGLADMTYGAGAMASGFLAAILVLRLGDWTSMTGVMAALVACYAALAVLPALVATFYVLAFAAGFCSSAFRVITNALLFKVVPNEVMGRTAATFLLASMLLQVAVTLAIGPLVNHAGPRGGFAALAAIVAGGLALLLVVAPAFRRLPQGVPESA